MNKIEVIYDEEDNSLETEMQKEGETFAYMIMSSIPYQGKSFENRIDIITYSKEDSYLKSDQEIDQEQQKLVVEIKTALLQKTISINPDLKRKNPIEEIGQAIYSTEEINNRNYVQELLAYYRQKGMSIQTPNSIERGKNYGK